MAIDRGGHLWAMDGSALFECNANGTALTTNSGYNANMVDTEGTAVDGDDRVWYFSYSGPTALGVMSDSGTAISPSGGYQNAILATNSANYFAIDGSGNVWVASDGIYVVEYVGIASPVITPLATATAGNKLATRP
jgi:sugar lactone lactonase YvrE